MPARKPDRRVARSRDLRMQDGLRNAWRAEIDRDSFAAWRIPPSSGFLRPDHGATSPLF